MDSGVRVASSNYDKTAATHVIELLSEDDDNDTPTQPADPASRSASPTADNKSESGHTDALSDPGSLYEDLLNTEEADRYVRTADPTVCTPEEADEFRFLLRSLGASRFIYETVTVGKVTAKKLCAGFGVKPPIWLDGGPDEDYYRLLGLLIVRELTRRRKLPQYNTIDDAVELLKQSKKIVVITGAGISTNLGVPDFRSKENGFYTKLRDQGYDDPQSIFELENFEEDPRPFYVHASETLPMQGKTSPTHAFIRLLQDRDQLLTNYTQNIDNVEGTVGIDSDRLIQCHGSWATFTCRKCGFKTPGTRLYDEVKAKKVPRCRQCEEDIKRMKLGPLKRKRTGSSKPRKRHSDDDSDDDGRYDIVEPGVMKPDITFFGEKLPENFFDRFKKRDVNEIDLLVVIGTSMKVAPVSEIPMAILPSVPQIYISRDPCPHIKFDVVLLGDCDVVTSELAKRAGWDLQHPMLPEDREVDIQALEDDISTWRVTRKITRQRSVSL